MVAHYQVAVDEGHGCDLQRCRVGQLNGDLGLRAVLVSQQAHLKMLGMVVYGHKVQELLCLVEIQRITSYD